MEVVIVIILNYNIPFLFFMSDNYVKKKPFIWGKLTAAFHPKKCCVLYKKSHFIWQV